MSNKSKVVAMPQWEYEEAAESYKGWCSVCCDFTHPSCEPDAEGYECPDCHGETVVGAGEALIRGWIEIK